MLSAIINSVTAPLETFQIIVKDFNWKQAVFPIGLLMILSVFSSFILSDQIADLQWEQIQNSINNNSNISEEQKEEILGSQYDRIYSNSGATAIFIYVSTAISWPLRIAFWSLFALIAGNLFLGEGESFKKVFTIASFAYLPSVLELIIKTPIQYATDNMAIFFGLGALGVGAQGEFLNSLLAGLDLFSLWRVYLMAVGFSLLYKKSINSSLNVVAGVWLFGIIIFSALGAFFAGLGG